MKAKIIITILLTLNIINVYGQRGFWYKDFYVETNYLVSIGEKRMTVIKAPNSNKSNLRYQGGDIVFPDSVTDESGNKYEVEGIEASAIPNGNITSVKIPYGIKRLCIFPVNPNNHVNEIPISFYPGDSIGKYYCIKDGFLFANNENDSIVAPLYAKKKYVIPEGVKSIYGFRSNQLLESVELPTTIERIGGLCFYDCTNLRNVHIPNETKHKITIGGYAFALTNVENFDFTNVGEIWGAAFEKTSLLNVILPHDLKFNSSNGSRVFSNCLFIKEMVLPDSVPIIGEAFYYTSFLPNNIVWYNKWIDITLPKYVERISHKAFLSWWPENLILPASVQTISSSSFYGVTNMYCQTPIPPAIDWDYDPIMLGEHEYWTSMFENIENLYVPKGAIEAYKSGHWGKAKNIYEYSLPLNIEGIIPDNSQIETIYDTQGNRRTALNKGVNILKMSDGTVKKIVVK